MEGLNYFFLSPPLRPSEAITNLLPEYCPESSHPYPYLNNKYCCPTMMQKLKKYGVGCNGGRLNPTVSNCCYLNEHMACPHSVCTMAPKEMRLSNIGHVLVKTK